MLFPPRVVVDFFFDEEERRYAITRRQRKEETTFVSVSKKRIHFFFISSSLSRAHFLRAFARAYNITFFVRARAHAREKVTRIAIIDRPLSMIVGGRVGALFFIVCFLSVYRYKSSVFVSLYRMADE